MVDELLLQKHCYGDDDRKENDLVQFEIDVGEALPVKQAMCMKVASCEKEISLMLCLLQDVGVIQPSCSFWASPVVLV